MLSEKERLTADTGKNADYFFRSLVIVAVASIVAILALGCYGTYKIYSNHTIMNAEEDAVQVGEALLKHEEVSILKGDRKNGFFVGITKEELPQLDSRLREFLRPFGIVKIKIYDEKHTIVYSTDRAIIGKHDADNLRLARALVGVNDSKLEESEDVLDLADEKMIDVDVVETYVPIRDNQGKVVGAFEIYMDVSKYTNDLRNVVVSTFTILFCVLFSVFGCSFLVIRKMTDRLRKAETELNRIAVTDPLTGIANRRQIIHRGAEEFARLVRKRQQRPDAPTLGVVMIDVDHFKKVNDTFGHGAGDAVLKEIAGRIGSTLRQYDAVGRYGGEEFLVILPETELEEAWHIAERIRRRVADGPVLVDNQVVQVSVSLGISSVHPGETDYRPALERADNGLYRAKAAGRNRVMCVDDERCCREKSPARLEAVKV
jgi:diguanylate cyclase (GGDEF)-like protein